LFRSHTSKVLKSLFSSFIVFFLLGGS